jgi:hypothetical protein
MAIRFAAFLCRGERAKGIPGQKWLFSLMDRAGFERKEGLSDISEDRALAGKIHIP